MRNIGFLVLLALLLAPLPGVAQILPTAQEGAVPRAFTLDSTHQNSPVVDLRGSGVNVHLFTWYTTGTVNAGNCALLGSSDGVTFGTTVISAQSVTSTGGPTDLTTSTQNYVEISCTTPISGTGKVYVNYLGFAPSRFTAVTDPTSGTIPLPPVNAVIASTTLVKLVSKVAGKKNYSGYLLVINAGASLAYFSLIEGTKTTTECDTGAVALLGSTTAGNGMPVAPSGLGFAVVKIIPGQTANQDWCGQNDGTNSLRVFLLYNQAP